MEKVTNTQVDPAVLIILVERICNDFMGPHLLICIIFTYLIYILCVLNIKSQTSKNKLNGGIIGCFLKTSNTNTLL